MNDKLLPISPEERQLREEAHRYARASMELEGFKLSAADEAHAQRYINGEIDLAQFVAIRPDILADKD